MSYIADIRDSHARIIELVRNDSLSRLLNRAALDEDSVRPLSERGTAVMVADINNFKRFNSLGHHVGDAAIQRVAQLLQAAASGNDCRVYRHGGDEFAIVAKNAAGAKHSNTASRRRSEDRGPSLTFRAWARSPG